MICSTFGEVPIWLLLSFLLAGTVSGSLDNPKLTFRENVKLWAGSNKISILSVAVGLPVSTFFVAKYFLAIDPKVEISYQ